MQSLADFQVYIDWFRSLYDIQWNFFGRSITLWDILIVNGFSWLVFLTFAGIFRFSIKGHSLPSDWFKFDD